MNATANAAAITAPQPARAGHGGAVLALLSCGHFFIDWYAAALSALLPLLVVKLNLTLTQAGMLAGLLLFSSSVMQPVYGYLSDRFPTWLFTALAPMVAGVFISALGLAPNYAALLLLAVLGGAGIASFHPQASAQASLCMRFSAGRSMAFFITSGTLGLALGPTCFSLLSGWLGLERIYWAAVPGVLVSALLIGFLPEMTSFPHLASPRTAWRALRAVWTPMVLLYLLVFVRSVVQITFTQFLPLYLSRERLFSLAQSNYILSIYLLAGAFGGLVGGHLADRLGGRIVIIISMIGSVPFLALFLMADGWLSVAGLAAGGLVLLFTIPVNVVMAQQLAPAQAGTVSALMMGFGWGMAGLVFTPLTGWISDLYSIHTALSLLVVFPVAGFFLALALPKRHGAPAN